MPARAPASESAALPPATSSILTETAVCEAEAISLPVSVLNARAVTTPLNDFIFLPIIFGALLAIDLPTITTSALILAPSSTAS